MKWTRLRLASALVFIVLALGPVTTAQAAAQRLTFDGITGNSAGNIAVGEAQLFADVSCANGSLTLQFGNSGPAATSIAQVYWDDSQLLSGVSSLAGSSGVSFEKGKKKVLPGGNAVNFNVDFMIEAKSPVQPNGVNPGERLTVTLGLRSGVSCSSVQSALLTGALRVGIHVQGYGDGGSESFVNNPLNVETDKPICTSVFFNVNNERRIEVQDTGSGIASIQVAASPTLNITVAPFTSGTTSPVLISAVSTDPAVDGVFTITVTDVAGNTTECGYDTRRPVCGFQSIVRGTPQEPDVITVYYQDYGLGLARLEVTRADNVTFTLPQFVPGTKDRVFIVATQIDVAMGWYIETAGYDLAGTVKLCDPVITVIEAGETETYSDMPDSDRYVVVTNGSTLPITVEVLVNEVSFVVSDLQAGVTANLDVGSALSPGYTNSFTLTGVGEPGAWADVTIWDIPPGEAP